MPVRLTRWPGKGEPSEIVVRGLLRAEDLDGYLWSNGALDRYPAHRHGYSKVIYVLSGSITFGLPEEGQAIELKRGDRLDLPRGTVHDASVGGNGVICMEAHKG